MTYKVTNIQKAQKEHYYVTEAMCEGVKGVVLRQLMDKFTQEIYWLVNHSGETEKHYNPSFHKDVITKITAALNKYSEFESLGENMKEVISSQIFFEHFTLYIPTGMNDRKEKLSDVSVLIYDTLFKNLKEVESVNFKLCEGLTPMSLYYTFGSGHPDTILYGRDLDRKLEYKQNLKKLVLKGANLDVGNFFKSCGMGAMTSHYYPPRNYKECGTLTSAEDAKVTSVRSAGVYYEEIKQLIEKTIAKETEDTGFAWKDYIYTGIGTGLCAFTISGINVAVAGAATPAYYFCAGVPVTDLGFDYLGLTEKYLASSFFISYNGIYYGFKYAPTAMYTAINNYFTAEPVQMPEKINYERLPNQNVPVFVGETPRKNDFNPHLEGRNSVGRQDIMKCVNKADNNIKSSVAKQELGKIGQKVDVASQNYKDAMLQRSH